MMLHNTGFFSTMVGWNFYTEEEFHLWNNLELKYQHLLKLAIEWQSTAWGITDITKIQRWKCIAFPSLTGLQQRLQVPSCKAFIETSEVISLF